MRKWMDKLYDNLDEARAFALSFTNFAYFYGDWSEAETHTVVCEVCRRKVQCADYRMPASSAKKAAAILHSWEFGVSPALRAELIARFDITEADFRPIRNKKDQIVYYQITPQHVLPPLHPVNSWPVLHVCDRCGHIRYECIQRRNDKDEEYCYISQEVLDDMHDLNVTCEHFRGDSREYIISRRLYDFLTELYPRSHYIPLFLRNQRDNQGLPRSPWTHNWDETGMMRYDPETGVLVPMPPSEKKRRP